MNRRDFLKGMSGILASGVAPAVFSSGVASGILMPVKKVILPETVIIFGVDQNGNFITEAANLRNMPNYTLIGYTRDNATWRCDLSKLTSGVSVNQMPIFTVPWKRV